MPDSIKAGLFPTQVELLVYEGREALYGGAAGGGKSVALLMAALQYVDNPGYAALILRRTYKQLSKADSILAKSKEWLWGKAKWNGDDHKWTFPSGATVEFGHMEHEDSKLNYQGGAWAFVGVDEATQFTGSMLAYPRTRQRRLAGSSIPIRWRGGSNPGGIGHDYVKDRYVKDKNGKSPCTPDRQFFPATLADNPNIDREEYLKQLRDSGVDQLTLDQLEKGDWDAVSGGRFLKAWLQNRYTRNGEYIVLQRPGEDPKYFKPRDCLRFFTVDPASSVKRTADWTVTSAWCVSPWSDLVWLGCDRFQKGIPDIVPRIQQSAIRFNPAFVGIEAVAANSAVLQLAQRAINPALICRALSPLGQDKLVRATSAINLAATGRLWLPACDPSFPVEDVEGELVRFTGNDKIDAHDDIVDTLSYAAEIIKTVNVGPKQAPQVYGG